MKKEIIAAILEKDPKEIEKKLHLVDGLLGWAQIDVADGEFVNNTTASLKDLEGINHGLKLSIHLMVKKPQDYLKDCAAINADQVVIHLESDCDHYKVIEEIEDYEMEKVLALNIDTPLQEALEFIPKLDGILLMSIQTGFGGQDFIEGALPKIKELSILAPDLPIYVDGGIKLHNIEEISSAGATGFIVGTGIYKNDNIKEAIAELKSKI